MKQLFQAHETVALKREVPVTPLAPIELHELVIEFGVVEYNGKVTTQVKVVKGLYTEVRNVQHVARGRVSRVFALIDRESFE